MATVSRDTDKPVSTSFCFFHATRAKQSGRDRFRMALEGPSLGIRISIVSLGVDDCFQPTTHCHQNRIRNLVFRRGSTVDDVTAGSAVSLLWICLLDSWTLIGRSILVLTRLKEGAAGKASVNLGA